MKRSHATWLGMAALAAMGGLMLPPALPPVQAQSSDATPLFPQAAFAEASGETVYAAICQGCHMPQGQGSKGAGFAETDPVAIDGGVDHGVQGGAQPALILAEIAQFALTAQGVGGVDEGATLVLDGRGGMPGFSHMLTDQQVAEVVQYVRTHFGNDYPDRISSQDVQALRR